MKPSTIAVCLALAAGIASGCGGDEDSGETTSTQAPATTQQEAIPAVVNVSIGDNFYKPSKVTIKRGQTVSWKNDGAVAHTVTSDDDSDVKLDSGEINPRSVYALKPGTVGTITYMCTIHGSSQSGTVTVER